MEEEESWLILCGMVVDVGVVGSRWECKLLVWCWDSHFDGGRW